MKKYEHLYQRMKKEKDTYRTLGSYLGITYVSVCKKMNGQNEWNLSEVRLLIKRYKEPLDKLFEETN